MPATSICLCILRPFVCLVTKMYEILSMQLPYISLIISCCRLELFMLMWACGRHATHDSSKLWWQLICLIFPYNIKDVAPFVSCWKKGLMLMVSEQSLGDSAVTQFIWWHKFLNTIPNCPHLDLQAVRYFCHMSVTTYAWLEDHTHLVMCYRIISRGRNVNPE